MTNYKRGYAFEREVFNFLKDRGWDVIRSAGSHGKTDIAAARDGRVILIQCKRDGKISDEERQGIWLACNNEWFALPLLAVKVRGGIKFFRVFYNEIGGEVDLSSVCDPEEVRLPQG